MITLRLAEVAGIVGGVVHDADPATPVTGAAFLDSRRPGARRPVRRLRRASAPTATSTPRRRSPAERPRCSAPGPPAWPVSS